MGGLGTSPAAAPATTANLVMGVPSMVGLPGTPLTLGIGAPAASVAVIPGMQTPGMMPFSRSSGSLRKAALPGGANLSSSASTGEFTGVRKAYSGAPRQWTPPASHNNPRAPVTFSWSDAATEGKEPPQPRPSQKERMLMKAEAELDQRLASASASLQTVKMASIDQTDGAHAVAGARSPPKRSKRVEVADKKLELEGRSVPSSNERLGLILSDLMKT